MVPSWAALQALSLLLTTLDAIRRMRSHSLDRRNSCKSHEIFTTDENWHKSTGRQNYIENTQRNDLNAVN